MASDEKALAVSGFRALAQGKDVKWQPQETGDGFHRFYAGKFTNRETGEVSPEMHFWPKPAKGCEEGTPYIKLTPIPERGSAPTIVKWAVLLAGANMGGHDWRWAGERISLDGAKADSFAAYVDRCANIAGCDFDSMLDHIDKVGPQTATTLRMFAAEFAGREAPPAMPGETFNADGSPWQDESGESY